MANIATIGSAAPSWVVDLKSFRKWSSSDEFPEEVRVSLLGGRVLVDASPEREDHRQLRVAVAKTLAGLVQEKKIGKLHTGRVRITVPAIDLSTEPDAAFFARERRTEEPVETRRHGDAVEMVGPPDWVMEIVGPKTLEKDADILLDFYHRAGVREYWLVNPLDGPLFTLYRRTTRAFIAVGDMDGWRRSPVFGRTFQIRQEGSGRKRREYVLDMR